MNTLLARLPWFVNRSRPSAPRSQGLFRLAPRRRTYRCLLLDGTRRDPVACSSFSAEEAAKTVAWEALTEDGFINADDVVIRVHVLGEAEERSFHFARSWHLASEPAIGTDQVDQLALAG